MEKIGERLTEARKNFGIDIRSAAEGTKIRSDFLSALEENKPERIKLADVYKIGFLRNYAKYLKLDSDRLVAEFRTQLSMHHNAPSKSGHRSPVGGDAFTSDGSSGFDGGSIFSSAAQKKSDFSSLFSGNSRKIAIAVGCAVVVVAVAFGGYKIFGGNDTAGENVAATVVPATPETLSYEFQIVSKIPQSVTIIDRYGTEGERATLLGNVPVAAGRPQTLVGRGILEIRDAGNKNLEIRFPSRAALLAEKDAGKTVKLTEADKSAPEFSNEQNWWTANPYLESRQ